MNLPVLLLCLLDLRNLWIYMQQFDHVKQDVYKRQVHYLCCMHSGNYCTFEEGYASLKQQLKQEQFANPVSYTRLDAYKRQLITIPHGIRRMQATTTSTSYSHGSMESVDKRKERDG